MRIAIVHDYLKEIGGAERVLMAWKEIWPEAPVYTAFALPSYWGESKKVIEKWEIHQSFARNLPFLEKFLSYYTIISPWFFKRMDLSAYDVVIVSQTGGYFPNGVKVGKNTKLITYCHTPPRFLYGYPTATKARYKWYWRIQSEIANYILRMVDYKFAQLPNLFIANSKNVAKRILKFYRRDSEVVYPPIEIADKNIKSKNRQSEVLVENLNKDDYFLIVSRIVGSKNIELAVEAANKYKFNLKVAGRAIGETGKKIAEFIKGETVEYLGEVSEEKKIQLFAGAMGFLALEEEPDFGMSTVEPMAYGTPVIAYRAGGYLETVVDGKTGVFFDDLTSDSLWSSIERFNKLKWDKKVLIAQADKFSKERFKKEMVLLVGKYAGTSRN